MTLERITENNLNYALQIQKELFPKESARANYEESFEKTSAYEYYLLYEKGVCLGIIGIYTYPEDSDSTWLGWFGIRESFRRKKLGSRALTKYEEMAISKGFRFARLYTDAESRFIGRWTTISIPESVTRPFSAVMFRNTITRSLRFSVAC